MTDTTRQAEYSAVRLRGWQLALGELLTPAAVLTGIQWFLLILVVGLFSQPAVNRLGWSCWLGMGFGAALVIPMLNLITLQIPNAATGGGVGGPFGDLSADISVPAGFAGLTTNYLHQGVLTNTKGLCYRVKLLE
jgi:hypothetical protein